MAENVLKTFIAGEKITASDTNSNNRYLQNLNTATAQELQAYLEQEIERLENRISGAIYQPGDIKHVPHDKNQPGFLKCDGSSLLREDYPDLFTAIGTIYGAADDYHFNIPDFQGCFLRGFGGNSASIGTKQNSAVPNITGQINYGRGFQDTGTQQTGALSYTVWGSSGNGLGNTDGAGRISSRMNIDASRSSSVYQNVNEARGVNYAVNYWIKY